MRTPVFRPPGIPLLTIMKASDAISFEDTTFDLEDSEDLLGLARSLINGHHPGILATVDPAGQPHLRWMSTLAFGEFPVFHTLTAANARKVAHIRANPQVNWMFYNKDLTFILNLSGRAHVLDDPATLKQVWRSVEDKTHTYFLNEYSHRPGFVAIETQVDSVECTSPASGLRVQVKLEDLQTAANPAVRAT